MIRQIILRNEKENEIRQFNVEMKIDLDLTHFDFDTSIEGHLDDELLLANFVKISTKTNWHHLTLMVQIDISTYGQPEIINQQLYFEHSSLTKYDNFDPNELIKEMSNIITFKISEKH